MTCPPFSRILVARPGHRSEMWGLRSEGSASEFDGFSTRRVETDAADCRRLMPAPEAWWGMRAVP